MTALDDYAKLEAEGQYFDGASPGSRSVAVSFGERSLVIADFADHVLAHWPLASLCLQDGEGGAPAVVLPDPDSAERLLLNDPLMVAAIGQVCAPPAHDRAMPGRKRRAGWRLPVLVLLLLLAAGWYGLSQTARLGAYVPDDRARVLGAAMLERILRGAADGGGLEVATCRSREGAAALDRLVDRLTPAVPLPHPLQVTVLDDPRPGGVALPGGAVLLFRGTLAAAENPEEVAGVLAHLIGHVALGTPLRQAFGVAGAEGAIGLVLGDVVREGVVGPAAALAMSRKSPGPEALALADENAFGMLAESGLPSLPFANFIRRVGTYPGQSETQRDQRARAAAEADRIGAGAFAPALDDRNWIALLNICTE